MDSAGCICIFAYTHSNSKEKEAMNLKGGLEEDKERKREMTELYFN